MQAAQTCPRAGRLHTMESFAVVDKDGYGVVVSPVAAPTVLPPSRPAHIDRDMTLNRWGVVVLASLAFDACRLLHMLTLT